MRQSSATAIWSSQRFCRRPRTRRRTRCKRTNGHLSGIAGSWVTFSSFYAKGAWSKETKEFGNEVAGTSINLNSKQTTIALGAGYHFRAGEQPNISAEALAIVDFTVDDHVPVVVPSEFGPPSVSTVNSKLEGNGFSTALGARRWISESVEFEAWLSQVRTRGDVLFSDEQIWDSETRSGSADMSMQEMESRSAPFSPTASIPKSISTTSESSTSHSAHSAIISDPRVSCGTDAANKLEMRKFRFGPMPLRGCSGASGPECCDQALKVSFCPELIHIWPSDVPGGNVG